MEKDLSYWNKYKELVGKTTGEFDNAPAIFALGIASEVSEVFDLTRKELIEKNTANYNPERISEIGDVLWYMAAFENHYDLPYPRNAGYLKFALDMTEDASINVLALQSESMKYCNKITDAVSYGEVDDVSYNINELLGVLFDLCIAYQINILECLNASLHKMNERYGKGEKTKFKKKVTKNYEKEYETTKEFIKSKGAREVLINLKLDNRKKQPYQGIVISSEGSEDKVYNSKNLIVDFFTASNEIAANYEGQDYILNYDSRFRKFLESYPDKVFSGYIYGEDLVSAVEMRKMLSDESIEKNGDMIKLGRDKGLPILMTPGLNTLDDLLAYVNKVRETTVNK